MREAISRAKADGLVRSIRGSGLYVASPLERRSFKVGEIVDDVPTIARLFELRLPLEVSAVRLAAARYDGADIARLEQAHVHLTEADDWSDSGVVADLSFHHAIAVATQNSFYADFMAFLGAVLQNGMRIARSKSRWVDVRTITIDEHARILRAIRNRDPESAARAMHTHIEGARDRMSTGHAVETGAKL